MANLAGAITNKFKKKKPLAAPLDMSKLIPIAKEPPAQEISPQARPGPRNIEVINEPGSSRASRVNITQDGRRSTLTIKEYRKLSQDQARQARVAEFNRQNPESPAELAGRIQEPNVPTIEELDLRFKAENPDANLSNLEILKKGIRQTEPLSKARLAATSPAVLSSGAEIIDAIRTGILGGKTTRVKQAESAFTDAAAINDENIELVRTNQISDTDALRDFERAIAAINRLEATSKGLGKANLRFWIDKGAELEAQISRERQILEIQRLKLIDAIKENQLNQITGLQAQNQQGQRTANLGQPDQITEG